MVPSHPGKNSHQQLAIDYSVCPTKRASYYGQTLSVNRDWLRIPNFYIRTMNCVGQGAPIFFDLNVGENVIANWIKNSKVPPHLVRRRRSEYIIATDAQDSQLSNDMLSVLLKLSSGNNQ